MWQPPLFRWRYSSTPPESFSSISIACSLLPTDPGATVKSSIFGKKIARLFNARKTDDAFFDELEEILIEGDVGAALAMDIIDELKGAGRAGSSETVRERLKTLLGTHLSAAEIDIKPGRLNFILVLGVNGVGKTTSIAKLARYFGKTVGMDNIILSAADTFRAAAVEQLQTHGDRLGLKVVRQERGSDPGAVIYDSLASAASRGVRLVIADTAGRMHNKQHLVSELQKIDKIAASRVDRECYHKMLVIDANTGQNGLRQAEVFHEALGLDSVLLAKYDSTSKGGIVIAISRQLSIPVSFLGTGETPDDIEPFNPGEFLNDLLGT
ncbi:MAG: signal recognition particle-docking protein FtsY [Spirochaetales bacterium]|nr:signal recognition particle-docking protein FtsY [Spirochaetales bacterium]